MANKKKDKKETPRDIVKSLPHTVYPRGQQGTFVYAPDIAVYVATDEYGIVDLSPFITSFTLQRNVNAPSSFSCTFDNKFARFDRVVRRMDRIVVFMKRIQWVQVFAGYVSVAPWQTIVPGDATLQAECTIKRVAFTYWDPHDPAAFALYPSGTTTTTPSPDGGAAATMFRLLVKVAGWDPSQIQIQRLPDLWLEQALALMTKAKDDYDADADLGRVKDSLIRLLDADGWQGVQLKGILANSGVNFESGGIDKKWTNALTGGSEGYTSIDEKWHKEVGKKGGTAQQYPKDFGTTPEYYSGYVPHSKLYRAQGVYSASGQAIYLRADAATSLEALQKKCKLLKTPFEIKTWYLGFDANQRFPGQTNDQKQLIMDWLKANNNAQQVACASVKCPAGTSDHGWGTAIDFNYPSPPEEVMNQFGWIKDEDGDGATNPHHWVFVGNYDQGYPAYTKPQEVPDRRPAVRSAVESTQFDWSAYQKANGQDGGGGGTTASSADPAFKSAFYMPQFSVTNAALGKRAWINNVSLLETVATFASASMRDFQSAPNGNFVSFFPDRLGIYGKFPAMQVRDIEIVDFKLIISDRAMVTHYASVGDFSQVQDNTGIELDVLFNSGTVSVEQDDVMALLLGIDLKKNQNASGLGKAILDKFGLRPKRDDNYNLYNFGYNYMNSLHRFQEAWANQWQALVQFTFLPEVFPGMRIELADNGVGVYVESVTHSGSRTGGFSSTVTISTPMRRLKGGGWGLLDMEFSIKDYIETDRVVNDPLDDPVDPLRPFSLGPR